jgi:hypothetical protein
MRQTLTVLVLTLALAGCALLTQPGTPDATQQAVLAGGDAALGCLAVREEPDLVPDVQAALDAAQGVLATEGTVTGFLEAFAVIAAEHTDEDEWVAYFQALAARVLARVSTGEQVLHPESPVTVGLQTFVTECRRALPGVAT